ncbi:DUF2079 domain-containing protein [Ferroplasma acidarmanus]|uniref:Multipass membrane protein n=1 Tax=Ferroplasma acidarmanus Fer1 TaxID=333146 RepID=S0AU61_FERAC|nr:DUF2079 domain-containing protein [Ferroplasma acidarmanus]AGO61914.1 hypothetical protein FACI_IFERC00001G1938 [Ferroplasma acidarmanus Fer1]
MLSNLHERIPQYIHHHKKDFLAFLVAISFAIAYSIFSIRQYYSLGTSAFDLGLNAQELYSFLHTGSFYTSLMGENALAQHFTLFKFIEVPLYYLFPSPITLMIFEDIFIALAGYIVYLISTNLLKDHIKSEKILFLVSIGFLLSYEFSPFSESLVSFSFHNMAFLPFFFLLAFYSFLAERRILHIVSIIFIISLHANFVYIVGVLLLYEFLFLHTYRGKKINTWFVRNTNSRRIASVSIFILAIVLLYGYILLAGIIKLRIAGISSFSILPTTGETGTPAGSPIGLILLLIEKPGEFISIISSNHGEKVFFINLLLKSNLYLPFFSPMSLILSIPYMLYAIPSSYASYYQLGYQYFAMLLGAIYISAIMGAYNLIRLGKYMYHHSKQLRLKLQKILSYKPERTGIAIVSILIVLVLVISLPYGILAPLELEQTPPGSVMNDINKEIPCGSATYLINMSGYLPKNAYILTENTLMPYFSNYLHVYVSPYTPGYYMNLSKYQYIIIQNNSFWATYGGNYSLQNIVNDGLTNSNYTIIDIYVPGNIMILENTHDMHGYIKK